MPPSRAPPPRGSFQTQLLSWYRRNGRSLPVAHTSDPYHILVSEVMLQQTQVDRVLPKYHEWLAKYPSFEALAAATNRRERPWRPLGYNIRPRGCTRSRARAWRASAASCPRIDDTLLSFKGIGAYTAGAIRSFAFRSARRSSTPTSRACCSACSSPGRPKAQPCAAPVGAVGSAGPYKHVFDFNQGLMDLGATVCAPRTPRCDGCPMKDFCRTRRRTGDWHRGRQRAREPARRCTSWRQWSRADCFLVDARQAGVHLAGCGSFPAASGAGETHEEALRREMQEELDTDVEVAPLVSTAAHALRRPHVTLHFYAAGCGTRRGRCWDRRCVGARAELPIARVSARG
jgi:A/G-specific adenine glycosylase